MDTLPSSSIIKHQEEENDDWVIVKKQKFTILIPPPSPSNERIVKETRPKLSSRKPKAVKGAASTANNGRRCRPHSKAAMVHAKQKTGNTNAENPNLCQPKSSPYAHAVGRIGAVNVVNLRIRAMNLERKLQGLGGVTSWPPLLGLDRFIAVFEWKKFNQYRLANLTMGKLKDMGMSSVGPRRKLIHAIDLLCQPYYTQDS